MCKSQPLVHDVIVSYGEILTAELQRTGLRIPDDQQRLLVVYADELERWNRRMNLTGLRGIALVRSLIVEPVSIAQLLHLSGILMDVGSGNGSPAIPICVTSGIVEGHLVEARLKRAAFLRHIVGRLQLKRVSVHRQRLEEMTDIVGMTGHSIACPDWITLQAVAPTPDLLEALGRMSKSTTKVVWVTSNGIPPILPAQHVVLPGSATEAWVFGLDQSWPI